MGNDLVNLPRENLHLGGCSTISDQEKGWIILPNIGNTVRHKAQLDMVKKCHKKNTLPIMPTNSHISLLTKLDTSK